MDDGYILTPHIPLYNHTHHGLYQQPRWSVQLVDIKYKYILAHKMYNTKFVTTVVLCTL
jgi:hypothetical protein